MRYAIGIDLGATNIKGLALSETGKLLGKIAVPTSDGPNHGWCENTCATVRKLERTVGKEADAIGIAAPGLAAVDRLSIACLPERLPGIEGFVWQKHLNARRPVPVLNDGHGALLGERWRGAARGFDNVALFTLGTGVGGAAMVDGNLLLGHLGRAGHFGHISLNPNGPPDVANAPGSLELAIGDCSVAARSDGRFTTNKDLLAAARKGDRQARAVWLDSVRALAAGIASVINVVSPELVLLGGGTSKAGADLFRPLRRFLTKFEWRPNGATVRLAPAKLGDLAGAYGAAWEALNCS